MRLPLALLALAALGAGGGGAGREAAGREAAAAGRFSTPERHRCSWELRSAAAGASELRVSCRPPAGGGAARSCVYRGEPRRCPAYDARSRRYWRQILGRLRRRRDPCARGGPLSARLCGPGRAPPEARLRLLPGPGPEPAPPAATAEPAAAEPTEGPAHAYCAERWHSLCSFFVGFWEG
ncbi:fibroblast growth factor-binding protein 3 [Opisthocomus hoazin]|uniref:fibroblast growth factor-binding protein 3 n=1 Tax=Opisthocomus hoazin TaxID=30419 RepID=UPI003F5309A2